MEENGINRIIEILSSKTNLKILEILMESNSYPRKIARKINKTEGVVVRALKSMEEVGLLESSWGVMDGRPAKVYSLKTGLLFLLFDFTEKESLFTRFPKKYVNFIKELLKNNADHFFSFSSFSKWERGDFSYNDLAFLSANRETIEEFLRFAKENTAQFCLLACYLRIKSLKEEEELKKLKEESLRLLEKAKE